MTKLGQHFLINKNKIKKIVEALNLKSGDVIVEIGPGHGELTRELRIKNRELKIIAIEKDRDLATELKKNLPEIEIMEGDVLKILPKIAQSSILNSQSYKLIGNIPYYITGYLLRTIGELENKPELVVLTIQKEVAERIVAEPPKNNLLAASVQFWAEPGIVDYISKNDFEPKPKVDSAIIKLTTNDQLLTTKETENYYKFIKILFKQPRKTILNNLTAAKVWTKEEIFENLDKIGINPQARPQNLKIKDILELSRLFN